MNLEHLSFLASGVRDLEQFCKEHSHYSYDQLHFEVTESLKKLKTYASQHHIPFMIEADEIVSKYKKEEEETSLSDVPSTYEETSEEIPDTSDYEPEYSDYEEESSEYEEEPSSYEEEEEPSEYEEKSSNY